MLFRADPLHIVRLVCSTIFQRDDVVYVISMAVIRFRMGALEITNSSIIAINPSGFLDSADSGLVDVGFNPLAGFGHWYR